MHPASDNNVVEAPGSYVAYVDSHVSVGLFEVGWKHW